MTQGQPPILVRKEGSIGWVILNRPEVRNTLSFEMQEMIPRVMGSLEEDGEVQVIVLTGAGDRAFCAGADVSEFKEKRSTPEQARHHLQLVQAAFRSIFQCSKVVIAMINGYAVGNGYMLAIYCDLRIAADTARIGLTSARLGAGGAGRTAGESRVRTAVTPTMEGSRGPSPWDASLMLAQLAGPANAKEVVLTGRLFPADQALRMGLVHEVVPAAKLESYTRELAGEIAGNNPLSVMNTKASINRSMVSRIVPGLGDRDY